MRLHFNEDVTIATNTSGYCLSRNMSECLFANTVKQNVEACLKAAICEEMWRCLEAKPHIAGHWGIGGVVSLLVTYLPPIPTPCYHLTSHPPALTTSPTNNPLFPDVKHPPLPQ